MNPHTRVFLFLQVFSNTIEDELHKRCRVDMEDSTTTTGKWDNLRKEALKVSTKADSKMGRLWNVK